MFRLRREAATIAVEVEGRTIRMPAGASAAAALLAAGWRSLRDTPVGAPSTLRQAQGSEARGPYCMIGVCFDCLAEIDGVPNRQSCMVAVRPGMKIRRQRGVRSPLPFPPPQAGKG